MAIFIDCQSGNYFFSRKLPEISGNFEMAISGNCWIYNTSCTHRVLSFAKVSFRYWVIFSKINVKLKCLYLKNKCFSAAKIIIFIHQFDKFTIGKNFIKIGV